VVASAGVILGLGIAFIGSPPGIRVAWWVLALITGLTAGFWSVAVPVMVRSRYATSQILRDRLIGVMGVAATDLSPAGLVVVRGAEWRAQSTHFVRRGESVEVTGVEGIALAVARAGPQAPPVGD
jgi:membrane-bound serine protease (ClpP class)